MAEQKQTQSKTGYQTPVEQLGKSLGGKTPLPIGENEKKPSWVKDVTSCGKDCYLGEGTFKEATTMGDSCFFGFIY